MILNLLLPVFRGEESGRGVRILKNKIRTPQHILLTLNRYDTFLDDDGNLQYERRDFSQVDYKLASCIIYDGTSKNGHYQTLSADGFRFDDNKVRLILDRQ
jgi:hypothetical protein